MAIPTRTCPMPLASFVNAQELNGVAILTDDSAPLLLHVSQVFGEER